MKTHNRTLFVPLLLMLLLVLMMLTTMGSMAAQQTVELGTAKNFGILAGSAITNTGPTTIGGTAGGDVGLSPATGAAITGLTTEHVDGTIYTVDDEGPEGSVEDPGLLDTAKDDLLIAYNDAASRSPDATISANLDGQTLKTGVYFSGSSMDLAVNGTLTLDGENNPDAVFIFQVGSTLTTGSGSEVVLINGAKACRVFWQVGSSATLGVDSDFVGHIFAHTSITANNGAEVKGQLLAINGAVTLENNEIINDVCIPPAPAINVKKYVSVDGGGTWHDAQSAPGPSVEEGSEVQFKFVVTNTGNVELTDITLSDDVFDLSDAVLTDPLPEGDSFEYILTATAVEGQHQNTATATGVHDGVTYSDTDVAHYWGYVPDAPATGSLTVGKIVTGETEGIELPDFEITVTGPEGFSATKTFVSGETFTWTNLVPGTYTVTEDKTGLSDEWTVTGEGDVEVVADETAVTTITNLYIMEEVRETPRTGRNELLLVISVISIALAGGFFLKGYRREEEN